MRPWEIIDRAATPEGTLELRRRGAHDWLITIAGRVLMTSAAHRSEEALATLACQAIAGRPRPRVLIGGLGMGYTLRTVLDLLPTTARVTVAELTPQVVAWCRGPLSALAGGATEDRRVTVHIADAGRLIERAAPGRLDAILLDLYEGPHAATQRADDPLYGPTALAHARAALAAGGVLAVWSEEADRRFQDRLGAAGFRVEVHRAGRGGRAHVVYIATAVGAARR